MFRKTAAIFLTLALALSVSACGNNGGTSSPSGSSAGSSSRSQLRRGSRHRRYGQAGGFRLYGRTK